MPGSVARMAPSYDCAASVLLCAEDNATILGLDEEGEECSWDAGPLHPGGGGGGCFLMDFPLLSEHCIAVLVGREEDHLPIEGYSQRLQQLPGGLDLAAVRRDAIDWIWKVYTYYNFGPLTAYVAVNYLDRFLSQYELPEGKAWMTQLLSVACLSLAAKMEETAVPLSLDLQVGEARYVFEAKTIQRMELLVLSTLKWRMQAVTPFSYIDYFLDKFNGGNAPPRRWVLQSAELILCMARGTSCLGFRPSEIAAAVAAIMIGEVHTVEIDKACTHIDKERVLQCHEAAIQSMALFTSTVPPKSASPIRASSVPQSPVGVLDAGCLSCRSDDSTIASHETCCHDSSSATSKRRKISR